MNSIEINSGRMHAEILLGMKLRIKAPRYSYREYDVFIPDDIELSGPKVWIGGKIEPDGLRTSMFLHELLRDLHPDDKVNIQLIFKFFGQKTPGAMQRSRRSRKSKKRSRRRH